MCAKIGVHSRSHRDGVSFCVDNGQMTGAMVIDWIPSVRNRIYVTNRLRGRSGDKVVFRTNNKEGEPGKFLYSHANRMETQMRKSKVI